ncbi:MAG: hypothetical protein ACK4MD_02795 [Demequina sp.]
MADTTPEPTTPEPLAPEQADSTATTPRARKKTPARKSVTKATPARATEAAASSAPAEPNVVTTPDPEPAPASAVETQVPAHTAPGAAPTPARTDMSILDRVRHNPVGPLAAGLVVAIAVGLLLSVLVPNDPSSLALILLGVLLSAAVGFTVRYLSIERGLRRQVEALIATVIGVHLMSVTGALGGDIPLLSQLGVSGPGFDEALIAAFATPPVSTGALVAGLFAAIIAGWARSRD